MDNAESKIEATEKDVRRIEEALERRSLAMEILVELRANCKRWFRAFIIVLALWAATIGGFVLFLSQYNFETSYEATGVYALIDSSGNIIAQDITDEQLQAFQKWWEVNGNGNSQGN